MVVADQAEETPRARRRPPPGGRARRTMTVLEELVDVRGRNPRRSAVAISVVMEPGAPRRAVAGAPNMEGDDGQEAARHTFEVAFSCSTCRRARKRQAVELVLGVDRDGRTGWEHLFEPALTAMKVVRSPHQSGTPKRRRGPDHRGRGPTLRGLQQGEKPGGRGHGHQRRPGQPPRSAPRSHARCRTPWYCWTMPKKPSSGTLYRSLLRQPERRGAERVSRPRNGRGGVGSSDEHATRRRCAAHEGDGLGVLRRPRRAGAIGDVADQVGNTMVSVSVALRGVPADLRRYGV